MRSIWKIKVYFTKQPYFIGADKLGDNIAGLVEFKVFIDGLIC